MKKTNEPLPGSPAPDHVCQHLRDVRRALLHLHKVLLDVERATYEKAHGRVSSGELLRLVMNDEHFAWLHAISELIVRIDEVFDADEPLTTDDAESLIAQTRALVKPAEAGGEFERRYYAALQSEPDAVLAHREVTKLL